MGEPELYAQGFLRKWLHRPGPSLYRPANDPRDSVVDVVLRILAFLVMSVIRAWLGQLFETGPSQVSYSSSLSLKVWPFQRAADETLADRTRFGLDADRWKAFLKALDAPPRELPRLARLFREPSVFDAETNE